MLFSDFKNQEPESTNIHIYKAILDNEDVVIFQQAAYSAHSLGYKGLDIRVFKYTVHTNIYLVCASGLGHTLNMQYTLKPNSEKELSLEVLLIMIYADFRDFVVFEREESGAGKNAMH